MWSHYSKAVDKIVALGGAHRAVIQRKSDTDIEGSADARDWFLIGEIAMGFLAWWRSCPISPRRLHERVDMDPTLAPTFAVWSNTVLSSWWIPINATLYATMPLFQTCTRS